MTDFATGAFWRSRKFSRKKFSSTEEKKKRRKGKVENLAVLRFSLCVWNYNLKSRLSRSDSLATFSIKFPTKIKSPIVWRKLISKIRFLLQRKEEEKAILPRVRHEKKGFFFAYEFSLSNTEFSSTSFPCWFHVWLVFEAPPIRRSPESRPNENVHVPEKWKTTMKIFLQSWRNAWCATNFGWRCVA